jgi:hypothetical protein
MVVFDAGVWRDARGDLDNLAGVGINTAYDPLNRLALAAEASLFSHDGAGHQIKINKASTADTASLLFQSGWAGHAEIGLLGDAALGFKTSVDGNTWHEVLCADPATEEIRFAPAGTPKATLSNTSLHLNVPLTGTAVQTSTDDTTLGRVLTTGAFGLGRTGLTPPNRLLDDITASGIYNLTSSVISASQLPAGVVIDSGSSLFAMVFSASNAAQILIGHPGNHLAWRIKNNGVWSDWARFDATSGVNSNGCWQQLDQVQTCRQTLSISLAGQSTKAVVWNFPAAFADASVVLAATPRASAYRTALGAVTATNAAIACTRADGTLVSATVEVDVIANGTYS